jgi:predicted transcriptional regulator
MTSCGGGGFKADVRKMADYACKGQKLAEAAKTDTTKTKEIESMRKEVEDFAKKMEEKYKDKKDDKVMEEKAEKIMKEVMEKCK